MVLGISYDKMKARQKDSRGFLLYLANPMIRRKLNRKRFSIVFGKSYDKMKARQKDRRGSRLYLLYLMIRGKID